MSVGNAISALPHKPLLVIVLGPTGSGKSALAVALAQRFQGEILSCDSVAVYRDMEVGTAKPSRAERAAVPHHLLDLLPPTAAMTAGDWARTARRTARAITARGHLPIVAGGTGLYLRALTEGLATLPPRCPALRSRLERRASGRPPGYLHRLLHRLDASAAARIHANDQPKLIRALEIALLPNPAGSTAVRDPLQDFRILRIGLAPERAALYAQLDRRAAAMFTQGLLEEIRALQQKYGRDAQALAALGYREAAAVLAGSIDLGAAIRAVQQGHRNYSKRQVTWFRREPDVHWLHGFGNAPQITAAAENLVAAELAAQASLTAQPG